MRRAVTSALALLLAGQAIAADPAARGIALQAQRQAAANTSALAAMPALSPAALPKFRAAMAAMDAGTKDAIIQVVGDSTSAGAYATSGGTSYIGGRALSYPTKLAAALVRIGIPARADSWFGSAAGSSPIAVNSYDPRIGVSAGWAYATGMNPYPAGGYVLVNTTDTGNLSFAPGTTIDTCDVYYIQDTTNGTFSLQSDSGAVTNQSSLGARSEVKVSFAMGGAGTHTLNIARVSGTVQIAGFECYNTASRSVRIRNLGVGSSQTANWISTTLAWGPGTTLGLLFTADLTIINLGINDAAAGQADSTIQTNLTAIGGNALRGGGDLLYIEPIPSNTGSVSAAKQAAMRGDVDAAAAAQSAPVISWPLRVTSFAAMQAAGVAISQDGLHPLPTAYQDFALWLRTQLRGHGF